MSADGKKIVYAEDVLTAVCMYCDSHIERCDTCPIKDAIMDSPDADAVPVRHAEWIAEKYQFCKCSACDKSIKVDYNYILPLNYCPNCGAKMNTKKGELE